MSTGFIRFAGLLLFVAMPALAGADGFVGQFVGQFDGDDYQLSIEAVGSGQYDGELRVDGERVALYGRRFDDRLVGQLIGSEVSFDFVITTQGSALLLQDEDGDVIRFHPVVPSSSAPDTPQTATSELNAGAVYINRVKLEQASLKAIESQSQLPIAAGRYWYDTQTGAWGVEGGPTAGLVNPGLPLPGPMPVDISAGGTGIFINGREIHPLDQQALYQLFGVTYQGYFWMDAEGSIGFVGGPAIANVFQASRAAGSQIGSGALSHGYDSTYGARGTLGGGMYSGRSATGKSVFWYPGM